MGKNKSLRLEILVTGLIAGLIFTMAQSGCTSPEEPSNSVVPWDSAFNISGIKFPNDTIFTRSIVFPTTNWRVKRFLEKCHSADSVKVGFIGGSITAGAWASSQSLKYSSLVCTSLKKNFPNLGKVVEINAGISATPSRFGVSRASSDLLSHLPDLVVIEFAVNDLGHGDDDYLGGTIEGLVRQCLLLSDDVAVMLLFTSSGDGRNVQEIQSKVGTHYSLPMISYRDAIWPLIEEEKVSFETFFADDPHPNDNGHRICAYLICSYLSKETQNPTDPESPIPGYLHSNLYEDAGILTVNDTLVTASQEGWKSFSQEKDRLGFASDVSGSGILTLTTRARELTLGLRKEISGEAKIRIVVDDGVLDTIVENGYAFGYTDFMQLYASDSNTRRTIRIESLTPSVFTIDYVLFAGKPLD